MAIRSFAGYGGAGTLANLSKTNYLDTKNTVGQMTDGLTRIGQIPRELELRQLLGETNQQNYGQNIGQLNSLMGQSGAEAAAAGKNALLGMGTRGTLEEQIVNNQLVSTDKASQRASTEGINRRQLASMEGRYNKSEYTPAGNGMFQRYDIDNMGNRRPQGELISGADMLTMRGQTPSAKLDKGLKADVEAYYTTAVNRLNTAEPTQAQMDTIRDEAVARFGPTAGEYIGFGQLAGEDVKMAKRKDQQSVEKEQRKNFQSSTDKLSEFRSGSGGMRDRGIDPDALDSTLEYANTLYQTNPQAAIRLIDGAAKAADDQSIFNDIDSREDLFNILRRQGYQGLPKK